jgi:hypothetical protein
MIKLLVGKPGEGKTKEMIAKANSTLSTSKGNIVFIGESNESILEIHHDIRFIDISEFPISSSDELIAFIHGSLSSNYDIETIFLDGIFNLFIMSPKELCTWLEKVESISEKHQVKFEISISITGEVPECFAPYLQ